MLVLAANWIGPQDIPVDEFCPPLFESDIRSSAFKTVKSFDGFCERNEEKANFAHVKEVRNLRTLTERFVTSAIGTSLF